MKDTFSPMMGDYDSAVNRIAQVLRDFDGSGEELLPHYREEAKNFMETLGNPRPVDSTKATLRSTRIDLSLLTDTIRPIAAAREPGYPHRCIYTVGDMADEIERLRNNAERFIKWDGANHARQGEFLGRILGALGITDLGASYDDIIATAERLRGENERLRRMFPDGYLEQIGFDNAE